jgi:hypothetical protein
VTVCEVRVKKKILMDAVSAQEKQKQLLGIGVTMGQFGDRCLTATPRPSAVVEEV